MPTPAIFLILATLLPLACFGLLLAIGRRMGDPLAGWIAAAAAAAGFALSMAATIAWVNGGELAGTTWGPGDKPIELTVRLLPAGAAPASDRGSFGNLNIYIDSLTIAMFNTLTPVAALVCAFGVRFLRGDERFARFFTRLQLLLFSMLGLVLSGNLLQVLLFWELIALAAWLLGRLGPRIGRSRAVVSFIFNRTGDAGLILGLAILFRFLGNATLLQLDRVAVGSLIPGKALTIVSLALLCAAAVKTVQWLQRVPIPAAAVVQSITVCAAGIYVLARVFPLLTPAASLAIAVVGLLGLAIGAILALRERDVMRLLAYSTVSQFGLMFMAIGIGSWVGGLFHLLTHAFFKSLLLLAAGGVVHAAGGEQRLSEFGGLVRKLPISAVFFALGLLAMAGAPVTGGYFSSESIFVHAGALAAARGGFYWLFFIIPAAVSALTGFYMTRCWMLIFWGEPRNQPLHERARERISFWFPLGALAILSIVGGSRLLEIDRFIAQSADETENYCNVARDPASAPFAAFTGQSAGLSEDVGERLFHQYAIWPFAVGIVTGIGIYSRRRILR
ncbi:MAG: proton-conducting transporter membrane subunit [Tepidisphaeraceae bacterium]|jgi:NADH-quinone oxidoreductase subunit L